MAEGTIKSNINELQNKLGSSVTLVAVSKTKPNEAILEAYEAGHRDFGENKVQELSAKAEVLPEDIRWHMIGHLQRNKVKYIAPFVHLIHSVDSQRLLNEINKQASKVERTIPCLLQVHIAEETQKFGWNEEELIGFLNSDPLATLQNVSIVGLMGMATFTNDESQVRKEFAYLHGLFEKLNDLYDHDRFHMEYLSTGMTGDYPIALEEGSNMVRIGTAIFGERNKH